MYINLSNSLTKLSTFVKTPTMLSTVPNVSVMAVSFNLGAPKCISKIGSHLLVNNSGAHIKSSSLGLKRCRHCTLSVMISVRLNLKRKKIINLHIHTQICIYLTEHYALVEGADDFVSETRSLNV